ncbi:hypothetical protein OIDMADRAFT_60884 [Oidiodendron maius Zn]|uniref:AMP-dependent synthetase/ligase domain-containing protein n=1 Tax=Oidiodendron maius (strain Zn) TaxID=913774 RepID=A0A0C3GUI1_OIDMZ|nr:hypothetical protein OIDMADRAFT_60884 [Oidiodendron maius Zn]
MLPTLPIPAGFELRPRQRGNFCHRRLAWSIVGNLVSATAHSRTQAIIGGAFFGLGFACRLIGYPGILELVPKNRRPITFALLQTSLLPTGFGIVICMSVAPTHTWRWTYWIDLIIGCISLIMAFLFYHPVVLEDISWTWSQIKQFDLFGSTLFAGAILGPSIGIINGLYVYPWTDAKTFMPVVLFFILIGIVFWWCKSPYNKYPVFPVEMLYEGQFFNNPPYSLAFLSICTSTTIAVFLPQVGTLFTQDPIEIGWNACAYQLSHFLFYPVSGTIFTKWPYARPQLLTYCLLVTLSNAICATVVTERGPATFFIIVMGIFHAGAQVVAFSQVLLYLRKKIFFVGVCVFYMIWALLGTSGSIIFSVISRHVLGRELEKDVIVPLVKAGMSPEKAGEVLQALLAAKSPGSASGVLTTVDPILLGVAGHGIQKALAESYRFPYLVSIALGGFACVLAAFSANVAGQMTNELQKNDRLNLYYKLEEHAKSGKYANKPFLIFEGRTWTFRETYETVLRYGSYFVNELGIKPKEMVAIDFTNSNRYIFVWLGLWSIGAVPAFINYNLTGKPLSHCIKASTARVVLIDSDIEGQFTPAILEEIQSMTSPDGKKPLRFVVHDDKLESHILGLTPQRMLDAIRAGLAMSDA